MFNGGVGYMVELYKPSLWFMVEMYKASLGFMYKPLLGFMVVEMYKPYGSW